MTHISGSYLWLSSLLTRTACHRRGGSCPKRGPALLDLSSFGTSSHRQSSWRTQKEERLPQEPLLFYIIGIFYYFTHNLVTLPAAFTMKTPRLRVVLPPAFTVAMRWPTTLKTSR